MTSIPGLSARLSARRSSRAAWALLCLALAACATTTGRAPTAASAPTLPAAWQAPTPSGAGALNATEGFTRFGDPLLPELIVAAQQASPTLSSAAARIARARATRVQAGAALLPTLDATATLQQSRDTPRGGATATAALGLQSSWEIDLFGGNAAGRDAAQARLQGEQAGWHDARAAVAAEVASSYVALRACEAQLAQTQLDADSRAETTRLTELSARAGFTPPADAALARASAAQGRNLVVSQRAACDTQLKSLVEITDLPEPDLRARLAAGTAQVPQPAAFSMADTVPAALLARRPDLAQAERSVVAAAGDRSQTQAREQPSVNLSGTLSAGGGRSAGVNFNGATWSFGPLVVDFPLFDGGSRAAASTAAQASYDDAVAQYRALARRAVREVESSLVALQSATAREADAQAAARDFELSLRATQARQQGGLASLFDLEAARRNAVSAQSALIDLQRERAAAWITLYRSLGGGYDPATLTAAAQP